MLEVTQPTPIGFDSEIIARVYSTLQEWTEDDKIPAAAIVIGRRGKILEPRYFGKQKIDGAANSLRDDAIFLIASPSKPVTAIAVLRLIESGQVSLSDPVSEYIPEFAAHGKDSVELRHLLTHTSGLPDQIPENQEYRSENRPLSDFVQRTCSLDLAFEPGTEVRYSSMAFGVLGEVVLRVTGMTLADYLTRHVFEPLGMTDTALGVPDGWWSSDKHERLAELRVPERLVSQGWNWNSRYWLSLGAPWGGIVSTPSDFAKICQLFLDLIKGEGPTIQSRGSEFGFGTRQSSSWGDSVLSAASAYAMTRNQLHCMSSIPEADVRGRPWGLGWRLNWPAHSANFGDLLGPRSFGHWGATGTLAWADPETNSFLVLFTTQPQEPDGRWMARISNMVCSAIC